MILVRIPFTDLSLGGMIDDTDIVSDEQECLSLISTTLDRLI